MSVDVTAMITDAVRNAYRDKHFIIERYGYSNFRPLYERTFFAECQTKREVQVQYMDKAKIGGDFANTIHTQMSLMPEYAPIGVYIEQVVAMDSPLSFRALFRMSYRYILD